MAKDTVAVLDFGSSKLTLLVGSRAVNNNFNIIASSDIEYAGFMNGEFLEEENLQDCIAQAISEVNSALSKRISSLYVGVPSEFCQVVNRTVERQFGGRVKITDKIIDRLLENADENVISNTHSVINISPLYFVLDGTNRIIDPIDTYAKSIMANVCFTMADNNFLAFVGQILSNLKINNLEFVCSALAEGEYLLNSDIKNHGALVVDCGYLTTSVSYFEGGGLTELMSFSLGGGQITALLSEELGLSFSVAEQVKQQLHVSLKPTGLDSYEVVRGNRLENVSTSKANEVAIRVIDDIIEEIADKINNFERLADDFEVLYLTGGGLGYIKGIEYYMAKRLGRKVIVIKPKPLKYSLPDLSGAISLLDAGLKLEGK